MSDYFIVPLLPELSKEIVSSQGLLVGSYNTNQVKIAGTGLSEIRGFLYKESSNLWIYVCVIRDGTSYYYGLIDPHPYLAPSYYKNSVIPRFTDDYALDGTPLPEPLSTNYRIFTEAEYPNTQAGIIGLINHIFSSVRYPITYSYTNSIVSGPSEAAVGDTVTVSAVPDTDYGITDTATQISVTNNDAPVNFTWNPATNTITFTMPDPS